MQTEVQGQGRGPSKEPVAGKLKTPKLFSENNFLLETPTLSCLTFIHDSDIKILAA